MNCYFEAIEKFYTSLAENVKQNPKIEDQIPRNKRVEKHDTISHVMCREVMTCKFSFVQFLSRVCLFNFLLKSFTFYSL